MKYLHIGKQGVVEKYAGEGSFLNRLEKAEAPIGLPTEDYLRIAADADFIVADAIGAVTGDLIRQMPNLKLIHSEGVAFNRIDLEAAKEKGIYVCNSKGMNAAAVAEQVLLLMGGMLRNVVVNDAAVRAARQIQVKEAYMARGDLTEIADCAVGLVGFGDIGQATAKLLKAYGVERIYYHQRRAVSAELEQELGARYLPLDELLAKSDLVSVHLPVTPETAGIVNDAFFAKMKDGAYFVNTARGELVDDAALIRALESGKLKMAGLDTVDREPVQADHPLLQLPEETASKILFSPHIGGITASSFRRSYQMISDDIQAVVEGRKPQHIVNGL